MNKEEYVRPDVMFIIDMMLKSLKNTHHYVRLNKSNVKCTSGVRQNLFIERVINPWNAVPPTVSFTSLSSFRQTTRNVDFSGFVSCH